MIECKGDRDYYGDFNCGWDAEFSCEECIINGGRMSPQTNKPFRGNRAKYEERARTAHNSESTPISLDMVELDP